MAKDPTTTKSTKLMLAVAGILIAITILAGIASGLTSKRSSSSSQSSYSSEPAPF